MKNYKMSCLHIFHGVIIGLVGILITYYTFKKDAASFHRSIKQANLDWWQKSIIYQIYPRSFMDSNGDGIGDLHGITQKLDYLKSIGINAIWINPIYETENLDFGYDVIDHIGIQKEIGTINNFANLTDTAHSLGIYVILDLVPNHTSNKNKWFKESLKGGKNNKYAEYYIWHEGQMKGNKREPPNNWLSCFGGPSWTWVEEKQAYYYHQYLPEMPDLNLRNDAVLKEFESILIFWMEKGVDGFRVDGSRRLFESEDLRNELPSGKAGAKPDEHGFYNHNETTMHPDNYGLIRKWLRVLDNYSRVNDRNHTRLIMPQGKGPMDQVRGFYEHQGEWVSQMPLNFNLINIKKKCDAICLGERIKDLLDMVPDGRWPNWRTDNHDHRRLPSTKGPQYARVATMLVLTLPGTPIVYYGSEIGMTGADVSYEQGKDYMALRLGKEKFKKKSRDPERSPMQWDNSKHSGFSKATETWLPVASDYRDINVKEQLKDTKSTLQVFMTLASLRKHPSLMWGNMEVLINDDPNIYAYMRMAEEQNEGFVIVINFGSKPSWCNFKNYWLKNKTGTVSATTLNFYYAEKFEIGKEINFQNLNLNPGQGLIVKVYF